MASAKKSAKRKSNGSKRVQKMAAPKKLPVIKDALSKGAVIKAITDATALPRKDVINVLECFTEVLENHVKPRGPGIFTMPGYLKIYVVKKAARPARKGINPFTGEEIMIKAKPARKVVKIKALKKLKELVA